MRDKTTTVDTAPEWKLLLCCARTRMDAARSRQVAALAGGKIDWMKLLRAAGAHGLMPLLHRSLGMSCPEAAPAEVRARLRDHFTANARRNLSLAGELLQLLEQLEGQGIPAVAFKGPSLAVAFYGNLALRQFRDLDLLIRPQDVPAARAFLVARGFQAGFVARGAPEQLYVRSWHEYTFHRAEGRSLVDLHWAFVPRYFSFAPEAGGLWRRLESVSLGDREVATLSAEDLLLYLCVHGTKHRWMRLGWICDIAELLCARPGIDWRQVMEQAEATGSRRMLFLGLLLAAGLLGADLPKQMRQEISADRRIIALAAGVERRLFRDEREPEPWSDALFHLRARERLRDRLRYCVLFVPFVLTPTAGELRMLALPGRLQPLYYVLRALRLAWKYGTKGVRSLSPRKAK